MDTHKAFEVGVRRKIPYLTNLFLVTAGLFFFVILAFDFLISPFKSLGQEMQVAIFYWVVPAFWKKVLIFSVIGFCTTAMIYGLFRYYKPVILLFHSNQILIKGKSLKIITSINTIQKIYCNDAHKINGHQKKNLA